MRHIPAVLLFVLLCLLIVVLSCWGKPAPTDKKKKDAPPTLISKCQFGRVTQEGRKFTISGNEAWTADGEISADGKTARLTWFRLPEGRSADGQYKVDDKGELRGVWKWDDEAKYDLDGAMTNGYEEWLHKVEN